MAIDPTAPLRTTPRFLPTSRYYGLPTASLTLPDGRQVTYLRRRFLPDPSRLQLLLEHLVMDPSERLDNLAAEFLGDPLQFWRICDANNVLDPSDLVKLGATVRITLPEGLTSA
jgi:hypothetical protein